MKGRWLVLGAASLLGLCALEIAARRAGGRDEGFYAYPEGLRVEDPVLGWRYRPGFRGTFRGARYADVPIEINSLGFRGPEVDLRPSEGTTRIAVLGDSITFGAGVRESEAYPREIEARLRERGLRTEVLNLGVNHYDLEREALLLEREAARLDPHAVLVGICVNDGGDPATGASSLPRPLAVRVLRGSALLRLLHRIGMRGSESYAVRYQRLYLERTEAAWRAGGRERAREALRRMARLAEDRSVRLVAAVFPYRTQLEEGAGAARPIQVDLTRDCADLGIPFLDLADSFAGEEPGRLFLPGDPWHPNPEGHRLAAESLARFLEPRLDDPP